MKWRDKRQSSNIEDRRGGGKAGVKVGGAVTIVALLVGLFVSEDARDVLLGLFDSSAKGSTEAKAPVRESAAERESVRFVSAVLATTEDAWAGLFRAKGRTYRPPKLVLFRQSVNSACGRQGASTGPFYCPADRKTYLDLSFFEALRRRFKAPGDFAQAYVIAHEIGHHVQTLLGISREVHRKKRGKSRAAANALSVRQELQADCFAGIWAHHADKAKKLLEKGDIKEGLDAAAAIGDDRLQRRAGRAVSPESFTHGTSAQRMRWFKRGLSSGRIEDCDTFGSR